MKARVVSFARGVRWLADGWRLFRAAPFLWLSAGVVVYILIAVASRIPVLGAVAITVLYPAIWVGLMTVARIASGERRDGAMNFLEVIRRQARAFAVLGVAYLGVNLLAIVATVPFTGGALARWVLQGTAPEHEEVMSGQLLSELALSLAFYSPAMLAYWFSPMLVAWHQFGPVKALFYSLAACLVNWRALLAFGLAVSATVLIGSVSYTVLAAAFGAAGGTDKVAYVMLGATVSAILFATVVAAVYASYRDVFGAPDAE